MSDRPNKKLRLYKFASEYNLSTDSLVDFLNDKGYKVKSHMAPLSDEMLEDIYHRFKKDIERAEKHYKKISEFHKRFGVKQKNEEPEVQPEPAVVEEAPVKEEPVAEEVVETAPVEEVAEERVEEPVEETVLPEPEPVAEVVEIPEPEPEPVADAEVTPEPEPEPVAEPEVKVEEEPVKVEEPVVEQAEETVPEPVIEEPVEEKPEPQPEPEPVAETPAPEPDTTPEPVAETPEVVKEENPVVKEEQPEPVVEEKKPAAEHTPKPKADERVFKTKTELELDKRKKGLTVLGKIDLTKKKKLVLKDKSQRSRKPGEGGFQRRDDRPMRDGQKKVTFSRFDDRKDRNERSAPSQDSPPMSADEIAATQAQQNLAENERKSKKKKLVKASQQQKQTPQPGEIVQEDSRKKRRKKSRKNEVDEKEVAAAIRRTMLTMEETTLSDRANQRKKKKKVKAEIQEKILEEQEELKNSVIKVTEFIAVNELANLMEVPVGEVIGKCIAMGLMVSINQRLEEETITLVADEFGFEVEFEEEYNTETFEEPEENEEDLEGRPPVVTIMGHVDHGKTSLLDYIRRANVVAGEAGGITQHIGAYKVKLDGGQEIAFLDTPGHEAFTAMRARGAKVTDIVVLIVAADDAVMPQTVEAINHAQAADVPIVIAINKIDKPNADVQRIKQQLSERNILVEDWGGKYQCAEISAKQGLNVDELLDKILLEAEILELKANHKRAARGTVIESQLDKGRGITATVLVQKGTLKIGEPFVAGNFHGRVRAMFDERNKKVAEAGPSSPALVLGFEGTPQAGDTFVVAGSEREAREIAFKRQQLKREQDHRQVKHVTLDQIASQISTGGVKELALIVKGDVDGSVEALADSLMKLSNEEVQVRVILKGVGAISESDVILAAASSAIIVGFHVRPNSNARKLAENEYVDIRLYNVIYDAINEVKSALEGLLSPMLSEELVATVEIRDTFKVPKLGTVAGCYVTDGKISRHEKIRLFRDGIVIYEGELASLRRFKDDVKEVDAGYECGLNIQNYNDIKVGDVIEGYKIIETKKTLED